MKTGNFILAALALLLGLAACTQEELTDGLLPEGAEGTPMVFTATGLNSTATKAASTRATVDGDWEGVTSVAVMIDGTVKEYSVTANAADNMKATLSSDDPHYWTNRNDITVTAWWPYTEGETTLPDVVVQADQSTQDGFEGSDFISAEDQIVTYGDPTLTFTHRTARVTVKLQCGTGISSVAGATVSLSSLSEESGNPSAIATYDAGSDTYEALTAPQTVASGASFIQVVLNGGTFTYRPSANVTLEAGYRYTYTIKVNATGLTIEGSTISDWTDGGGESGVAEVPDNIYDRASNTYKVYTAYGLLAWNRAAQDDPSINCTLGADIDLTGNDWTPVGNYNNQYTGTFDGGDYTITGLTVNQSGDYAGLIGYLSSLGKVQNLTLDNVSITSSGNYVGSVVGENYGTVTDCSVSGSVSGGYYVGGVVGQNDGTVTACTASCTVTGSGDYVGGVVGHNYGSVTACTASGSVTGPSHSVGGVVGRNGNNGIVIACNSLSSVSGNYFVGGVAGQNESGTVTACYHASGSLSADSSVGGVVGYNYGNGSVTACYWSDYDGDGFGDNSDGTVDTTKVDGTSVFWSDAVNGMNSALETNQSDWRYELLEGNTLPTLKKNE